MCERVVAELVPVADELLNDLRVTRDLAAEDEERRGNVRLAQDIGDLRRPTRIRSVVEAERDAPPGRRLARDEAPADGGEDRPATRQRCGAVRVVRLGARTDRVGDDPFEEDQGRENQQAEAEQAPVGRRPPEPGAPPRAQGFLPDRWLLPCAGVVVVVVVVVVAVVFV